MRNSLHFSRPPFPAELPVTAAIATFILNEAAHTAPTETLVTGNRTMKFAIAIATVATIALQATAASAVPLSVKRACIGDYFSYCSQHAPGSSAVRQCFRKNGLKISKSCVGALVKAGMVSKAEVSRRAAAR